MDPSKRDTLIQWINAINPDETIESLQDLRDGEQFISLLRTITKNTYDEQLTRKDRFEKIQKFIENFYGHDFNGQVNFDRDNELDIAKMLILVLSAGVQGEYQEQFMTPALSLIQRSQVEIMTILQKIVSDSPNKLNLDNLLLCRSEDTYDSQAASCVFSSPEPTRAEDKSCPASAPVKGELQTRSTSTSSLNEIMSPFQRINVGYSPTTPLHSLIASTGFSGRILQRERNLRKNAENEVEVKENLIKKLSSQLNMERHLRSDVEMEMQEKVRTINTKDDKIRDLMTQNRTLKQLQDRLDELNTLKEDYDRMVMEAEKSKSHVEELKDLRLTNSSLQKEANNLYSELNTLKEMKTKFKILQLDCSKYLEELQKEEKKCSSLQSNLDLKQKALADSISSKNFTEDNLSKMKEMYEDVKRQHEEVLAFQSANEPSGERMTVITDQLMDELKKELDDLKNTWIPPNTHEELKIKFANVGTERDTIESKSLKLNEEVLQMQSDNDLLKKKNETSEIELEKCQRHLQDGQRNVEKLTSNLAAFDTKETQWHQADLRYKTDIQQLQSKMGQMQMELSCVSTELKLTNAQLENDCKSNEMRRQTLVVSVSELRNEKKVLEQSYETDKAAVEEKAKSLKSQLETLKMEFASREQELLAQSESVAMERRELEQQLETERRHRDNIERNLTSQREEIETELNETIGQLKEDLKSNEDEIQRLRCQLREKISEYDGQVESLTNVKFELQAKVNKLDSQASLDKQERLKLQADVKKSGERAEELDQNLGRLTEKLNKAIAEKKESYEKSQDIEKKLAVAVEESRHWMSKNSADKKTFETKITTLEQERAESVESSRCTLEKLSEELRSSSGENCELKSQLQKRADLLTDTRAELEEKVQHIESVQDQHSQLQTLHTDLQEQNFVLNNNLVMSQSQLACKDSEVTDLERKLDEISTEKTCLVETHEKELGDTRQALSQEIVNLNEQIGSSKSALVGFVEQVGKLTDSEFGTDDINSSLDIGNLVASVGKGLFHTVSDHSKKLEAAEERCTSQETQLLQLGENLQVKLQEADLLKKGLVEATVQCEQLQATKEQQLEENAALIKGLEEQKASLDNLIVSEREGFQNRLDSASREYNTTVQLLEDRTACVVQMQENSVALNSELQCVQQDLCQLEATHNELQQEKKGIEEQLSEKKIQLEASAQKTSEMTLALTEKDSLIESQSETRSCLEESVASLNQKLTTNGMEIDMLKSDLEQKDALIEEKKVELSDLSGTLDLTRCQMTELTEEHMSAIAALQQEVMLDYDQKLDGVIADYENNICVNYVSQSQVKCLEAKQKAELEELRVNLEQERENVLSELQEEHKASLDTLTSQFETKLSTEYVQVGEAQEQNRKHFLEVEQLQKHFKEYETKLETQEREYKGTVDRVVLEYKEKIATEFIPNSVFAEHKEQHLAEMTQIQNVMAVDHEQKVQRMVEEHEVSLKQLTCNYEETLTTDYVPLQTVREEKENLVVETRRILEAELQEKSAAFQQEHDQKVQLIVEQHEVSLKQLTSSYEQILTTDYVTLQTLREEKDNLVVETRKCLESEMQEKTAAFQQEHEQKLQLVTEQHDVSMKQLTSSYEAQLTTEYMPLQTVQEEKENLVIETRRSLEVQLQEKIAAVQQEHGQKVQSMVEQHEVSLKQLTSSYNEKLNTDYVTLQTLNEEKEKLVVETREILESEMQQKSAAFKQDHDQKLQLVIEQHEVSLKQLTCSFEKKLSSEYMPRQTVQEEKDNLVVETRKCLELEMQEKEAALQREHETRVGQIEQRHQEMLSENYVERSALADVAAKLTAKERELSQQRAESDLIVATSESVKEQHEASVNAYGLRVSQLEERLGQQDHHISCLEEQVVNDKFDGERQANETKRTFEGQLKEMKKQVADTQQELSTANETHKVESNQLRTQVGQLESRNQDEMTRLTKDYQKDFEQMKQDYQSKIVEVETTYKTEIDQLKECHQQEMSVSNVKYEEIHQNLVSAQSEAEEAVSSKEEEMKEILTGSEQLKTEKSAIEEKLSRLESEITKVKHDHDLVLKSLEERIASQNCCINQLKDERLASQSKCDKAERHLLEREQKLILENMKTLSKAEEMNKSLGDQLQVAAKEVSLSQKKVDVNQKEVDALHSDLKVVKQMKLKAVNELQEYKMHLLELEENYSSDKSQLEKNIRELQEKYAESSGNNEHLSKLVTHYKTQGDSKWSKLREQNGMDLKNIEKLTQKISALDQENKSLKREEDRFKAMEKENRSLHRKVEELKDQLAKTGAALFNEKTAVPFELQNDSLDSPDLQDLNKKKYDLRSRSGIWNSMKVDEYNVSPLSFQSRSSTSSYKSITSTASTSSNAPPPPGCGKYFSCEDEPEKFNWGRISEIKRRNTMVPAHLKSTYPAELQDIPDEDLAKPSGPGSGKRKRKSPVPASKTQQGKERPRTPGKMRRLRTRPTLNNENSPQSDKKRLRTSPTPLKQAEYTGRPSMAFDISNTPKLGARRQKGRSTIFNSPHHQRQPLKTRNVHQTNL